jgi:hypothetical protein
LGVKFLLGDKVRKTVRPGIGYESIVIAINPTGIHVELTKQSSDFEFTKHIGSKGGSIFSHYELIE